MAAPRPPGPTRPLVTALRIRSMQPLTYFAHVSTYGDLSYLELMGLHIYIAGTPELSREVLVTQGRLFKKGQGLEEASRLLGNGLLTAEGADHLRARRLAQPAFHRDRIAEYADVMVATTRSRAGRWTDGRSIDVAEEMASLTLEVVGRTLFGAELAADEVAVREALASFMGAFDASLSPLTARFMKEGSFFARRLERSRDSLDEIVYRIIDSHRRGDTHGGLLSHLMDASDAETGGSFFTDAQLRDEVLTLVLAGHETTANALAWTWLYLQSQPDLVSRLAAEVDAVGGDLSYGSLRSLPLAYAVIAESMRLSPPAWGIGRRALTEVELDGWTVPARSLVMLMPWVVHRDPRWWGADALAFRPDRWLTSVGAFDPDAPGQPRGAYFPFGGGARVCIGESFAWTEAVLLLATMLSRAVISYDKPDAVVPRPAVTLRPAGKTSGHVRLRAKPYP